MGNTNTNTSQEFAAIKQRLIEATRWCKDARKQLTQANGKRVHPDALKQLTDDYENAVSKQMDIIEEITGMVQNQVMTYDQAELMIYSVTH
jgi:hypothetical protein